MNQQTEFTMTEDHIKLLRAMWVGWNDVETGAPEIDPKRPYGNSDVDRDVADELGWTLDLNRDDEMSREQSARAMALHRETELALQIVLQTAAFEPGQYVRSERYVWSKVPA